MEIFYIEILQDQYQNICSKQKRKQKAWNRKIHFPQQQNQHWTAPKRVVQVHIQEQGRSYLVVLEITSYIQIFQNYVFIAKEIC